MAALMNHDATHGRVELGHIWYVPAARRTTTHTEVAFLAMVEAFEHLRVRRFEWKCVSGPRAAEGRPVVSLSR
jgi:RimJ/RimL family protein N-acetyltransferase